MLEVQVQQQRPNPNGCGAGESIVVVWFGGVLRHNRYSVSRLPTVFLECAPPRT
jgi:hypothetical protein